MSSRHTRTVRLFAAVSAAAVVLSGVVVLQVVMAGVRDAGTDPDAAADIIRNVLFALLALGVVLVGVAIVAGRAFARALRSLRELALARARGDTVRPAPDLAVAELAELGSAIERLAAHVTAREARMAREAAEVSVLLDTISEGILQLDREGRVVRANPAARALLGLPRRAIGEPVAAHIRHAGLRRLLERATAGEVIPAAELALEEQQLIFTARPLEDSGSVVAFVDLTLLRRLESVRRDFVANVSHELKTPLTSIRGYVETLLTDGDLPPDVQRQFLEVVHKNADRLHHIVDDLLDLSRLESGGWRPELHEVDALEIIADVWSGCSRRAEQRHITFVPPEQPFTVHADPGGLRQVLSNLLDNAVRYTPDGGRIEVRAVLPPANGNGRHHADERSYVTFEVRDTGAGIPSDALPRIFERFYRVDPARSRAEGGTGLGLSIVKHLVESMGGDVRAESELGKGTVIRFRLPAARWQKHHRPELPQSSDS